MLHGVSGAANRGGRGMNRASHAQEPSMEEILASIRRIIAHDEAGQKPAARSPEPHAPEPEPEPKNDQAGIDALFATPDPEPREDVLELAPAMQATPPARVAPEPPRPAPEPACPAPNMPEPEVDQDVVFVDFEPPQPQPQLRRPEPEPTPRPRLVEAPLPVRPAEEPQERLLSPATDAAVTAAFSSLSNLVLERESRTLEDLVTEMLRPLLKAWLDDNLPKLVERLVREEIERVSRGRR